LAWQLGASEFVRPLHIDGKSEVVQHTISKRPSFTGRMGGTGHGALKSDETRSRNSVRLGRKKGQVCRKLC
jgi:alpha-D-ribose 1-methylphosphonate 5-triphosphate synthase subunit PhnG